MEAFPSWPSKFSFEYLLLPPRSAPTAAPPGSHPRFCSDRRALLLIEAWLLPRRPGIVHHLRVPTGMLTLEPFSEDQGRSAVHPPQADALSTQMPRHAVRCVLQTTIKAAASPRRNLGPGPSLRTLLQTTTNAEDVQFSSWALPGSFAQLLDRTP
ncbi:unnamed protein product [Brassica napus]|uniref:(rape) hypothetical protein n=1 Tax=Brassica napus TaxID=3708 RepID=A0A816P3X5_BRANA|nr:unnamed protein product [Brassica napus]